LIKLIERQTQRFDLAAQHCLGRRIDALAQLTQFGGRLVGQFLSLG